MENDFLKKRKKYIDFLYFMKKKNPKSKNFLKRLKTIFDCDIF